MVDIPRRALLGAAVALPFVQPAWAQICAPSSVLRIRAQEPFRTFDPADAWAEEAIVARNILAPLVRYQRDSTGQWAWGHHLAARIETGDNASFEIILREEAWTGGSAVLADDLRLSFERIAGLSSSPIAADNRLFWEMLSSVDVVDDRTAVVRLRSPQPGFILDTLANVAGCIVSGAYLQGLGGGKFGFDPGPTSGRYELAGPAGPDRVHLRKDPDWQGDAAGVEEAEFIVVLDDDVAKQMFLDCQLDVYRPSREVLFDSSREALAEIGYSVVPPTGRMAVAILDSRIGTLGVDQVLRAAVQQAVDPFAIAEGAYGLEEMGQPLGMVPLGWSGQLDEPRIKYDPAEANALVRSSNYGGETLSIISSLDPAMIRAAAALGEQLREIGVDTEVFGPVSTLRLREAISRGEVDIGVTLTPPHNIGALSPFGTFGWFDGRSTLPLVEIAEYDALLEEARFSGGGEFIAALQDILLGNGSVVPLAEDRTAWWLQDGIEPAFDPNGEVGDLGDWVDGR